MKWDRNYQPHWSRSRTTILFLLLVLLLAACGASSSGHSAVPVHPTTVATSAPSPASTPVAVAQVKMVTQGSMYAFEPATLTVKVGTEVIWSNNSNAPHTVSSDMGLFDTSNPLGINPSQTYAFTFTKPGSYSYYCNIHTYMTGKIIVTA
ncbi:MAG: hypothetical protein NVS4B7_01490 [Ktedonobacteraceae bacterium]